MSNFKSMYLHLPIKNFVCLQFYVIYFKKFKNVAFMIDVDEIINPVEMKRKSFQIQYMEIDGNQN